MYNIVTTLNINQLFKKSKFYKKQLGWSITDKTNSNNRFKVNEKEEFRQFYMDKYKSFIQMEGNMGSIKFYSDHYMKRSDEIIIFYKEKDFVFIHNKNLYNNLGAEGYLNELIKEIETKYFDEIDKAKDRKTKKNTADASKVFMDPGSVTYEDILKYKQK